MPLSIFGIWSPRSSTTWSSWPGGTRTVRLPHLERDPELAERRHDRDQVVRLDVLDRAGRRPSSRRAPRSSRPRCAPGGSGSARRASSSTPVMRRMFEPIPSIRAPSETRKWQRSWMCGSQAACPTIVSPSASTAAITAFSVAITDASSRNIRLPRSPSVRRLVGAVQLDLDAELHERVDVRVEPAAADHVAARRRHGRAAEAGEQRPGEQERRPDLAAEHRVELRLGDGRARRPAPRSAPSTRPSAPRSARISTIVSTSRMRGTFSRTTGSEASTVAARIGSAPFLLPAARTLPESGRPPSITNDCIAGRYRTRLRGGHPRQGLGDADALHAERGAPPARARGRGLRAVVRAPLRRGRGALGLRRAPARLRLRDPPDARQAPAGRRADPPGRGLPGGA